MKPEDFKKPSGKLIQAGRGGAAYWAHVPEALPPQLEWDNELARRLSAADRALGELAGLGRSIPNPNLFVAPFLRREAVLSSRIEGTRSGIADLYFYEAGQPPLPGMEESIASEADVHEVLNYVRALEYGLERLAKLPVSLRLLREIHAHLLEGVRGAHATPGIFRTRQNWIGGENINEAVYVPPPVSEMKPALDAFEKYLHASDDYPALIRLSFIHYQFEAIHPFVDGNGRIGRLLLSLLAVNWKLLPLPLLYLSAYFEHHRQTYYDLLLAISQRGSWKEWVTFFLTGIQDQANDTTWRIKRLQDLQAGWRTQLGEKKASATTLWLLDYLFESPVISIPQAQKVLRAGSYHTAKRSVERLLSMGILETLGKETYDRRFVARDILLAITEEKNQ
jgi:Fic family protein